MATHYGSSSDAADLAQEAGAGPCRQPVERAGARKGEGKAHQPGRPRRWLSGRDIAARRRIAQAQAFLAHCGSQGEDFFAALVRYLATALGMDYVCIAHLEDEQTARAVAIYAAGTLKDNVTYTLQGPFRGTEAGPGTGYFQPDIRSWFPQDVVPQGMRAEGYAGMVFWDSRGRPSGLIALIGEQPLADPSLAETLLQLVGVRTASELERRQAEAALRASEARYRSITEQMRDVVFTTNAEGIITYLSPAGQLLFGLAPSEMTGHHFTEFLAPDAIATAVAAFTATVERGTADRNLVLRMRRRDGSLFYGELSAHRFENGGTLGVIRDITERKQAEEALLKSEKRYRDLSESAPLAIFQSTLSGQIITVNPAFASLFGYESPEEIYATVKNVATDIFADPQRRLEIIQLRAANPDLKTFENLYRRKDGSTFLGRLNVCAITDSEGQVSSFVGFIENITEHRRAEEALRESERDLRRAQQVAHVGSWQFDLNTRRVFASEEACRIYGLGDREWLVKEVQTIPLPEYRAMLDAALQGLVERGQPYDVEFRIRRPTDGALLDIHSVAEYDRERNLVIGTIQDITERKQLEQRLRQHERLAAVGQLAAGIAHDFRNLLTSIMLYTQLSLRSPDLSPKIKQAFEIILGESKKAADLVQQILDFSGRALVKLRPLDLRACTADFVATLRRTIPENIRLTLTTGTDDYTIAGDSGQIQQVLLNLALNSRDAMPAGGDLRITLSRLQVYPDEPPPVAEMSPGAWICLTVADTGTGMTEEVYAHLFEPFFTTKEVGKGTGLGLAQVYGIVRQHKGYISVTTAVGAGTTFRIYLPATKAESTNAAISLPDPPRGDGETLLLVEDNENLREGGRNFLEALGYQVLTAAHGREALEVYAAAERKIDLVITDIIMPEMGGKELLLELRQRDPRLKALGVTGHPLQESLEALQQAGFLDVIHKPFEIETLAQVIRQALATRLEGN